MGADPALSVVVPVYNEQENVAPLVDAVRTALRDSMTWELVFIDDGSSDGTRDAITAAQDADPRVKLVPLARNYGQTAALQAGFDHSSGQIVVGMDGDLQNDPADIPMLVEKITEGYDLVAGYRVRRQDAFLTRRVPSIIANRVIRTLTGVSIRDNGCSLKAYRRELIRRMSLYSDLHRFIPAMALAVAGARIVEVPVRHHPRTRGTSKYGLSRVWKVLGDLLTILMIRSFREQPLVFFGLGALAAGVFGIFCVVASVYTAMTGQTTANALVLPTVAAALFALSWYLVMLGLITEGAIREARLEHPELTPLAHRG